MRRIHKRNVVIDAEIRSNEVIHDSRLQVCERVGAKRRESTSKRF